MREFGPEHSAKKRRARDNEQNEEQGGPSGDSLRLGKGPDQAERGGGEQRENKDICALNAKPRKTWARTRLTWGMVSSVSQLITTSIHSTFI